jgi:hypothetical protein
MKRRQRLIFSIFRPISGQGFGALDLLFEHLIYEQFKQKDYLDFGISTDDDGYKLDRGLLFKKKASEPEPVFMIFML